MPSKDFFASANRKPPPPIFEGFGSGIKALNASLPSNSLIPFDGGRAYRVTNAQTRNFEIHIGQMQALAINESDPNELLHYFRGNDDRNGTLYMGTAGLLNFSYIAAMRPGAAILFDNNPAQVWFWNHVLNLLVEREGPEQFMDSIVTSAPDIYIKLKRLHIEAARPMAAEIVIWSASECINAAFHESPLHDWRSQISKPGYEWIGDRVGYSHLQEMARQKAIGVLTLDVLDKEAWAQLAEYLIENVSDAPRKVQTMYISNVITGSGDNIVGGPYKADMRTQMHEAMMQVFEPVRYGVITADAAMPCQWSAELKCYCATPPGAPQPT